MKYKIKPIEISKGECYRYLFNENDSKSFCPYTISAYHSYQCGDWCPQFDEIIGEPYIVGKTMHSVKLHCTGRRISIEE